MRPGYDIVVALEGKAEGDVVRHGMELDDQLHSYDRRAVARQLPLEQAVVAFSGSEAIVVLNSVTQMAAINAEDTQPPRGLRIRYNLAALLDKEEGASYLRMSDTAFRMLREYVEHPLSHLIGQSRQDALTSQIPVLYRRREIRPGRLRVLR